jgi:hypothetical protein
VGGVEREEKKKEREKKKRESFVECFFFENQRIVFTTRVGFFFLPVLTHQQQ